MTALFAAPQSMPPLDQQRRHSSDYGVKINHPTSYDDNPSFKGPIVLEEMGSPDYYRRRIRHYMSNDKLRNPLPHHETKSPIQLNSNAPTATIIKAVVEHLARKDAPVDVKEVAESTEFYLRIGKRMFGAARRSMKNKANANQDDEEDTITIYDLCSGHGLTGMMFVACNPPRGNYRQLVRAVLVDQSKPQSHNVLREIISEVCPWVTADTIQFESCSLEDFKSKTNDMEGNASIVISTHACGSLTDTVLSYAVDKHASAVAVMPCCYTGTDQGTPYGLRRMLGVSLSADVRRSFYLQDHEYHGDFATIPKAITPMNRIIVGEKRK
ncbi:hypothetical protein ACHAXN_011555 [Cyclotella atomus]